MMYVLCFISYMTGAIMEMTRARYGWGWRSAVVVVTAALMWSVTIVIFKTVGAI